MGDYFQCDVKRNNDEETFIATVYLRVLPRIGEHLHITTDDNKVHRVKVKDIWHFVGGDKVGHKVQIYVDWVTKTVG